MKISLIDVDSKIPNLALMKISAYHKAKGDQVELNQYHDPDLVYISVIFQKNRERALGIAKMFSCPVKIGGPAIGKETLPPEVENQYPDYSLYRIDYSMGYTQRGCIRNCPFCIVPKIEGKFREVAWFDAFHRNQNKMILFDNNFLASKLWCEKLQWLIDKKIKVNFTQGLDIRLVDKEKAEMLAEVRYSNQKWNAKQLYFAFDNLAYEKEVRRGIEHLLNAGIPPRDMMFYVLVGFDSDFSEDYRRYQILWEEYGVLPFIMVYNGKGTPLLRHFARWVNKRIHKITPFSKYNRLDPEDRSKIEKIIGNK